MPNPIQGSFTGGEYSPNIYSRVDIQRYSIGLRTCKNFLIHPYGGVSNRPGTKLVAEAKNTTKKTRVVRYVYNATTAYVLEFGEQYIRFFKNHLALGAPYEVSTPYLEADLMDLKFEVSADVIYIFHPEYQTRTLSRFGDTSWTLELYAPEDGPFMLENIDDTFSLNLAAVTGTSISLNSTTALFNADHAETTLNSGALFKLTHYVPAHIVSTSFSSATTSATSIECFTTWRVISHGTWTGKFRIEKSTNGGLTWTSLREFSSVADFNANTYGTEDPELHTEPFLIRVNMYSYTSGTANIDLSTDPYYQDGICRVKNYYTPTSVSVDILSDAGSTENTTSWSEGSWSKYRGFPTVGVFNLDRLCIAATVSEPMTIWMSKTGNYNSYGRSTTLIDTDGMSVNLISRQINAINGLVAMGDLIALTAASEWRIGSVNGTMTPTTVTAKPQGWRGSHGEVPTLIGNEIVYVQANGKVIRNLGYDFQADAFVGDDIRVLSEHLFDGHEIVDIAYQQDNDSVVWCVRDDGILLALTYMKEQEVVGWSWHETDGLVESICVIPSEGYDELWMVVNRNGKRYIEYMTQRTYTNNPLQQFFVDSGVTYQSEIDISNITNATEAVVTTDVAHGLSNGDRVTIEGVGGMTEINDQIYQVRNKTTDDFSLSLDGAGDPADLKLLIHCDGEEYSIIHSAVTGQTITSGGGSAYTKLMIRFDGVDGATSYTAETGQTVTFAGTAQLDTAQKKFGLSSLLLDGNSDYVTIPDSDDWHFGTGDFTIDFWVKLNANKEQYFIGQQNGSVYWRLGYSTGQKIYFNMDNGTSVIGAFQQSLPYNTDWNHIALIRKGNSFYIAINGVLSSANMSSEAMPNIATDINIGNPYTGIYFDGWIDEVRVSKGIARWTEDFTVMTIQYPDLTDKPFNDINIKKFGTASIRFLGNGYLTIPTSSDFDFGSSDFTVDFWCRVHEIPATTAMMFSAYEGTADVFSIHINSSGAITFNCEKSAGGTNANYYSSNGVVTVDGLLHHYAIVRNGGSLYIFQDGISLPLTINTAIGSNSLELSTNPYYIAASGYGGVGRYLNCNIDEFRVTNGRARWTANFVPPTAAGTLEYVDSSAYGLYTSGGTVTKEISGYLTGLDHLEGEEVAIIADGVVLDNQTVSSGSVNLASVTPLVVHVGLPYESDLETLNVELGSVKDTLQGRKVKISGVTFRLLNTRGGWIGPDSTKLYEALSPERLGLSGIDLFSGDYKPLLGAGYEDGGRVFFRQKDPLPVTITSIIPSVHPGD